MVKIGFIAEGATEKKILEKTDFFSFLQSLNISYVPEVIDANGNGNLLPHNIIAFTQVLFDKGATHIFILTDLDIDLCVTETKLRIAPLSQTVVVVSKKAVESWFLADTTAMNKFLNSSDYVCEDPESVSDPFTEIKSLRLLKNGRGVGGKLILADLMIRSSFSIQNAALHPACSSAKYFVDKLILLAV